MKTFTSKDYSLLGYNLAVNPYNWLVVMNQYTVAFSVMPLHSLFGSDPEKVVCARQRIQTLDFISLGSESLPGSGSHPNKQIRCDIMLYCSTIQLHPPP